MDEGANFKWMRYFMNLYSIFDSHQARHDANPYPSVAERKGSLQALKQLIINHSEELVEAVNQDFSHRARTETLMLEISPTLTAIDYCLSHVSNWMKKRKRDVPFYLKPATACLVPQPRGVIGIMVPWNYPLYLALIPLAYALASGNQVMLKPSELTPATAALLQVLFAKSPFKENVSVIIGDIACAKIFATLPFGHLAFTGSTATGRSIMESASQHLTPVTLELGGKSPAIISASIKYSYIARLFMGKLFNAGQTCIAPDYLLVDKTFEGDITLLFRDFIDQHYPSLIENDDYTSLISQKHKQRLEELLADALEKGARAVRFGSLDEKYNKMPVYLLFDVHAGMRVMKEEIFGPLLPVLYYNSFAEALSLIKNQSHPLALYYFGENKSEINALMKHTLAGALVINDTLMHSAVNDLPFGGIGNSGMGAAHGREGFDAFSHLLPLFKQSAFSKISWFYPPYGWHVKLFLRYFSGIKDKKI